jgi:hypothetical protein
MGFIILTIAITVGLSGGAFLGYWPSKSLAFRLSKSSIAPRLVMVCSTVGAILLMLPSLLFSFLFGGNIGGGFGAFVTESIGLGSTGAPVGLAFGIAVVLGSGLVVGALVGGMFGRLLTHVLPESVLTLRSSGTGQKRPAP